MNRLPSLIGGVFDSFKTLVKRIGLHFLALCAGLVISGASLTGTLCAYVGIICLFPLGFDPRQNRFLVPFVGSVVMFLLAWIGFWNLLPAYALLWAGTHTWLAQALMQRFKLGWAWTAAPAILLCYALSQNIYRSPGAAGLLLLLMILCAAFCYAYYMRLITDEANRRLDNALSRVAEALDPAIRYRTFPLSFDNQFRRLLKQNTEVYALVARKKSSYSATLAPALEKLDPAGLEKAYRQWIMPYVGGCLNKQIGIDGKTIRGASNARENEMTLHMVSAWVREDGVSLGQIRTEEKSNEITAIPQLLDTVDIAGAVVSIDAMGCQKEIARKITEKDANYLLALKLNQPTLYREVEEYFDWAVQDNIERDTLSRYESTEKEHGRISIRTVTATTDVNWFESKHEWAYLRTFIMVERRTLLGDEETYEKQYYVSSLVATAKRFSELVRGHWSIENQLHWMLDVTFGEDASRIHKDHSAENLSLIRKIALTLLKKDTSRKASVARKQNRDCISKRVNGNNLHNK